MPENPQESPMEGVAEEQMHETDVAGDVSADDTSDNIERAVPPEGASAAAAAAEGVQEDAAGEAPPADDAEGEPEGAPEDEAPDGVEASGDEAADASDGVEGDGAAADAELEEAEAAQWQERLEALTAERDQLANQYVRLKADFENFRRRKAEEFAALKSHAAADLVSHLLPVLDNLERAVAVQGDVADDPKVASVREGVELVLRQFRQALEKVGVEPLPGVGEPFDPQFHEAVMEVPGSEEFPPGTIVEELQKGYRMGERIVRYSMVKVAAS